MCYSPVQLLSVLGRILNFGVKESPVKVGVGTVEKLTLGNMGIAFEILT